MPLRVLHLFAAIWGYLLYRIPNRARDTTLKNLTACFPEKEAGEIASLARKSLQSTASTALEMGKAWLLPIEKTFSLVTQTKGLELLTEAIDRKQGVILLTPHLSNWEIFGLFACKGVDSIFLYQPPKIPKLDNLLRMTRSRSGLKLAATNRKGVSQILSALQAGELVGILPDQVPADESGVYAPFFAEQALTMTLVSKLIARTNARVFCGFAERLPRSQGFRAVITPADELIYSKDLEQSVTGLNRSVESCVKMAVSQYQWEYKRFRRRPDGEKFY